MPIDIKYAGQGPWKPAEDEDISKDNLGYTHPNLHRRLDIQQPTDPKELLPREYQVGIYGRDSYRTTTIYMHDEDDEYNEIP